MDGILNQQEAGFWNFLPNKNPHHGVTHGGG